VERNPANARPVRVLSPTSVSLDRFAGVEPANAYLAERVDVTRTPVPSMTPTLVSDVLEPAR
jgi:hypothetical protein